jgi:hypothetical protein
MISNHIALIIVGLLCVAYLSRRIRKRSPYIDFDLASANEKFEMASQTRRNLNAMENLMTELQVSSPERQIVIHMEWIADEEIMQQYDLYCDGYNLATDKMREISEREINELRNQFAYQCNQLQRATRHRKNDRLNDEQKRKIGEWLSGEKDVRDVWFFNGD